MDKLQLIGRLAALNPQLKTKDAELAVKVMLDALCTKLKKGGRVEIRGFGSFALGLIQPAHKRNPTTGGKIKVPVKYIPQFKPAKELRERVDAKTETPAAAIHMLFTTPHNLPNPAVLHNIENRGNLV